ncbi:hypothetical protein [Paenibacillus sp. IHBB 10380]|uniref:hypothetical protein n=1 Tax=Paenibacillus sp. IHBB 10380 TaxID=1566358 RepID=UPI0011856BAE|nr:hypothetical protein [Paenibacillus sp. IHBB 10380]
MIVIRNFNSSLFDSKALELYSLLEIELIKETTVEYYRGFYINYQDHLIGIVATEKGPLFFYDRDHYLLQENSFRFILRHQGTENTFHFVWNGTTLLGISYLRVLCREDSGAWVDDHLNDFFFWLDLAVERRNFYSFYTVS